MLKYNYYNKYIEKKIFILNKYNLITNIEK